MSLRSLMRRAAGALRASGRAGPDGAGRSLRGQLVVSMVVPIVVFIGINTIGLYRQALDAVNVAYDRSLLASARAIGERLHLSGERLQTEVPYAALEIFEADNASRMYYRITGFKGEFLSGYRDLPPFTGRIPARPQYAALVHFYEDAYRGEPVRMAALYQPVAASGAQGVALIQVAETLELRRSAAREILLATLGRQAVLVAVIAVLIAWVAGKTLRPVEALRRQFDERRADDLSPLIAPAAPRELQPMIEALNDLMARQLRMVHDQRRFVRDASHQLRTPLAVLKTQLQSALAGDTLPQQALQEMAHTIERATRLANQMLALAKVEQMKTMGAGGILDASEAAREVALDLSPLIAQKSLDFEFAGVAAPVCGHAWMLRELTRNLLHNAIRHTPHGGALGIRVDRTDDAVSLVVWDTGPGLGPAAQIGAPFATGDPLQGSGLGLVICREIAQAMGGTLEWSNRHAAGAGRSSSSFSSSSSSSSGVGPDVIGLEARARFPARSVTAK